MSQDMKLLQNVIYSLTGCNLTMLTTDTETIHHFISSLSNRILKTVSTPEKIIQGLQNMHPNTIYEFRGLLSTCYFSFLDASNNQIFILGPTLTETFQESESNHEKIQLVTKNHANARELLNYFRKLPVNSYDKLYHLIITLLQHFSEDNATLNYQRIRFDWNNAPIQEIFFTESYDDISQIREVETRYENSNALTEAIKAGNLSLAYYYMRKIRTESASAIRNPNPLRNMQNYCIVMNTSMRLAMAELGFPPYRIDTFSHNIAMNIEKLQTLEDAIDYSTSIIKQYCELAQEKKLSHLKPFSRLVTTYIHNHLSDALSVKETAKALNTNADYLSHQFHQEVGMTFIDYVNQERIRQAASLLMSTDVPIQQIAFAVGYNHTSYFGKQFSKIMGHTPSEFRKQGFVTK